MCIEVLQNASQYLVYALAQFLNKWGSFEDDSKIEFLGNPNLLGTVSGEGKSGSYIFWQFTVDLTDAVDGE